MKLGIANLDQLDWQTRLALEDLEVGVQSGWSKQHKGDGSHGAITGDSMTVTGNMAGEGLRMGAPWRIKRSAVITPTMPATPINNFNPPGWQDAYIIRIDVSSGTNCSGFAAPTNNPDQDFVWKLLMNNSNTNFTLLHNDSGSSVGNRIICPNNVNFSMAARECVWILYDTFSGVWRVLAF